MIITVKELLDIVGNGTAFWVRTADEGECINYSREEVFTRFSHRDVFEIRCEDTDELIIVLEEEAEGKSISENCRLLWSKY